MTLWQNAGVAIRTQHEVLLPRIKRQGNDSTNARRSLETICSGYTAFFSDTS